MSEQSNIEWTDATWNVVTGCNKISPGCANCYIDRTPPFRMAGRRFEGGGIPLEFHANRLTKPLSWRKPRRVFVNSLSDLFHEDVPEAFIDRVFGVMDRCRRHTFQVLTKRADRMQQYIAGLTRMRIDAGYAKAKGVDFSLRLDPVWPLPNVWLGVSVENRKHGLPRIDVLRSVPAAVRFLSVEPLLESLGPVNLDGISWVIVGGESGPGSRPCDIEWVRDIIRQCRVAAVPVFVKQLGSYVRWDGFQGGYLDGPSNVWPRDTGTVSEPGGFRKHLVDKKGGDPSEWPEDIRVRQFPA